MNKYEYDKLHENISHPEIVTVSDLKNKSDRTLLWGYTTERASHHVYLKDGEIHVLVYTGRANPWPDGNSVSADPLKVTYHFSGSEVDVVDNLVIPNKRLYPEACDREFCRLLLDRGLSLPFTTWDDARTEKQFHGVVV